LISRPDGRQAIELALSEEDVTRSGVVAHRSAKTGQVHALVRDRHRSLKLVDAAYPTHTAIKLILDNHSVHISKETKAWLAEQPVGHFEFTFTPKHDSWLNLVEGFFSKLARSVLRHIRVASKQELKDRIMAAMMNSIAIQSFTPGPTNSTKLPDMIRFSKSMHLGT
jgi:transposase